MTDIFNLSDIVIIKINNINIEHDFKLLKVCYDNQIKNICFDITDDYVIFNYNPHVTSFKIEVFNKISDSYHDIIYDIIIRIDDNIKNICYFNNTIINVEYTCQSKHNL